MSKEVWVNPAGGHMGRSAELTSALSAQRMVMPWSARALKGEVPAPQP